MIDFITGYAKIFVLKILQCVAVLPTQSTQFCFESIQYPSQLAQSPTEPTQLYRQKMNVTVHLNESTMSQNLVDPL